MGRTVVINKRFIGKYSTNRLKVFAIPQGDIISIIGVRFTGGGHHFVYSKIPNGQIWIAEELFKSPEHKYYILHELYEHHKMAMGMSYDDAHLLANKIEGKARKADDKTLDEMIQREIEKNKHMIHERSIFNGTLHLHKGDMGDLHKRKKKHNERMRVTSLSTIKPCAK
jgi:hypothetical protein